MQKQVSKKTVYEDTPALELRSAGLGDIKDILHAQFTVFPNDPANLDEKGFERAISDRAHRLLVAYLGSSFAGYVIVSNRPYRPWSSLDNLIVLPEFSGRGVGRRLLHAALLPFQHRPILRLFVEKNNLRAVRMYKRNGFLHLQTRKNNYENNDDALIMYKFVQGGLPKSESEPCTKMQIPDPDTA